MILSYNVLEGASNFYVHLNKLKLNVFIYTNETICIVFVPLYMNQFILMILV